MTATETVRAKRKSWLVLLPLLLVVLVAVVWSGVWVYASNRAQREIAAWMEREAKLGRVWNCAERKLEGFPFRFELLCREPSLEIQGADPIRVTAANVHAVAQLWNPNHIVAEFAAPARVEDVNARRVYDATWTLLQMSGIGDMSGKPQRLSLSGNEVRITTAGSAESLLEARHLEFHVRRNPTATGGRDGVDYAAGVSAARSSGLALLGDIGPVDASLQGTITEADDLRPMHVTDRVKAWALSGGVAKLEHLSLTAAKAAFTASGQVAVDPQGLLNGTVQLGFSGIEDLLRRLSQSGAISREFAAIAGAMAMSGSRGEVAGRKGITFSLALKQGVLQLGQFPVGRVPPLF